MTTQDDLPTSRVEAGVHVDMSKSMTYGDYLHLDDLLGAQVPISDAHDEMLFIVIHHVQELWIKQIIHEINHAMGAMRRDDVSIAFKNLARVARIQEQLLSAWDVLSTLTPSDYLTFRDRLGKSSGFQSYQYRKLEFLLGAKDPKMMKPHAHRPEIHDSLNASLDAPSLYDEAIQVLARKGFQIPEDLLNRDFSKPHRFNEGLRDVWLEIYRNAETHFDLYQLGEELVDVEDWFQQWRFRHMKTVERIIGHKMGTGGSSGVGYLKTALDRSFFPELWDVRTLL